MFRYFANIETTKLVLWCYLAWYLAIVIQYFDPLPDLWLTSLGIGGLIGFALNLAAKQKGQARDGWVVFRLYLFPFCVSSYSALVKGKGFFLLFPSDLWPLLIAIGSSLSVILFTFACRYSHRARSTSDQQDVDPAP